MYKYLQNFSVKNIILFAVIFFTTIIFSVTILYLSLNGRENSMRDSKIIVDAYTKSYAVQIEGLLNQAMSVTRTLAYSISENKDTALDKLNPVNKNILENVLRKNSEFLQVWFDWDIKIVDAGYPKKYGRVGSVVYRSDNENYAFDRHLKDTTNVEPQNDYTISKKTGKEMVGEPYHDDLSIEYKGVLMISPTVPIIVDEFFWGWAGIDLDMRYIQKIVEEIKPYRESISYLVSHGKNVAAHSNSAFNKKSIFEVNKQNKAYLDKAFEQIDNEKPYSYVYQDDQGESIYVSMFPISIGLDKEIWTLATETPLNKVLAKSKKLFLTTLLIGFLGIFILCIILYFILRSITKRLLLAVNHSQKISEGDLTSKIDIQGKNELATLATSLNRMAERLKDIIGNITNSSESINSESSEINNLSTNIAKTSLNQAASVEEVMASIEEMTSNIHSNSDNAKQTEEIAEKALHGVQLGSNSANKTAGAIKKIAEKISIIHEISHQTNILSLNAAVEAARAGEHGKGFAVVANEVKKLAEKAKVAAVEISELSNQGVQISDLSEKELSELLPDIEKTAQLVREIATANREQSHGATEIQNIVQQLNDIAQKNASFADELNSKAQNLSTESEQLHELIKIFRI